MSENSNAAMNILELPLEALEKILSYVPNQLTVAQTCTTFYDISCHLKSYRISVQSLDSRWNLGIYARELEENGLLLQSLINSKKRINSICLFWVFHTDFEHPRSLNILFERFGHNLSELRLHQSQVTLEHFANRSEIPGSFQLDLPNLRELVIDWCPPEVLEVFNHLPDNVLAKVVVDRCVGTVKNVFGNQQNIKELTWCDSGHLAIDISKLHLVSLNLQSDLEQAYIDTISNQEHLEHLEFDIKSFLNLSSVRKLTKLKKLKINDEIDFSQSLGTLKSLSVIRKLKIYRNENGGKIFERLSISSFLEQFPKLESFSTNLRSKLTLSTGFAHSNLKRLHLDFRLNTLEIQYLLKGCVGLEIFKTREIDFYLLKTIMIARPNLKVLCIEEVVGCNVKFIKIFCEFGKNLDSFHIQTTSAEEILEMTDEATQGMNGGLPFLALLKAMQGKKTCCDK